MDIRILLLADSHLGFDLPAHTRIERRRRGHDFLANYARALAPALNGEVDVVVHGGDVFDRPRVPASLAYQAFEPLRRLADGGIPVFIVPGNHERSRLPHARLAAHPRLHVFDRPRTFALEVRGQRLALSGFPFERRDVRTRFAEVLGQTGWRSEPAAARLLCVHHCVEGATVGPGDFTFTSAADVIRHRDIPPDFAAVFSGHIHRQQVLTRDLRDRPVASPVLYPGSIERTALAEMRERKGFLVVTVGGGSKPSVQWEFRELPARPMLVREVAGAGLSPGALHRAVCAVIGSAPADAVLTIRVSGQLSDEQLRAFSAARLRTAVPASMNVEVRPVDAAARFRPATRRLRAAPQPGRRVGGNLQLELGADPAGAPV